jgi:hypothetical protein
VAIDLTEPNREAERADQRARLDRDRAVVDSIRNRATAAVKGKRVELHIALDEVAVLVKYAGAAIHGYTKALEREAGQ